jgi:hypothetical protein
MDHIACAVIGEGVAGLAALDTLARAWELAVGAASFDRGTLEQVAADPHASLAALLVPFAAGASELMGQAYVLAERRVRRWRATASLVMTGLVYIGAAIVWSAAAHLFLALGRFDPDSELVLLGVIAIGYAPRVLSFLTIAPYYGEFLDHALDAWSMACVGWGLWVLAEGPIAPVLACAVLGWLCSLLLRRLGGRVTAPVVRRLGLATGPLRHD